MFGIFDGPSQQEQQQYGKLTSASDFATNLGEQDANASSKFMGDILSGDSTRIATALAPQIGQIKTSAQQQNKTTAEMGTRSGGTAASTAATNDKAHSDITELIGQLTGNSASGLMSAGAGLLGTGISGTQTGFSDAKTMQQQRSASLNGLVGDIMGIGKSVVGGFAADAASPAGANRGLAFLGGAGF